MPKAYISAPYTSKAIKKEGRPYGEIKDKEYIKFLESVASILRDFGFTTILPHKHVYEWGGSDYSPDRVIRRAFESLKSCDLLVAYPEKSEGVNVLIGWASLLGKKIIILLHEDEKTSIVHEGLKGITDVRIIKFKDKEDLKGKLKEELQKIQPF